MAEQKIETTVFIEKGTPQELQEEYKLAMECSQVLEQHYPGHPWAVNINTEGGIAIVKNYAVSSLYGYVIHLKNLIHDPKRKAVIKAGGEILERAALARRCKGDVAKYVEGLADRHQPTNRGIIN